MRVWSVCVGEWGAHSEAQCHALPFDPCAAGSAGPRRQQLLHYAKLHAAVSKWLPPLPHQRPLPPLACLCASARVCAGGMSKGGKNRRRSGCIQIRISALAAAPGPFVINRQFLITWGVVVGWRRFGAVVVGLEEYSGALCSSPQQPPVVLRRE